MDCEMYQKMFDEMNQKREKKIYDRNEEKRKWNNYLDKYNMRYGYKNRYNNCDICNRPIQDQKKQLKRYPPPRENVVNVNSDGEVTGLKTGSTQLKITSSNGKKEQYSRKYYLSK